MVEGETGSGRTALMMRKICRVMMQLGISALPRNYELIHEALSGRHPLLARDLAALGSGPAQDLLDELGLRHRLPGHLALQLGRLHAVAREAVTRIDPSIEQLAAINALTTRHLEDLWDRITAAPLASTEFAEETRALREVVAGLRRTEIQLADVIQDTRATIKTAARQIEDSRKAGNVDPVTGLYNRAALAERLETLQATKTAAGAALVLVVVEKLQTIGEQHGPACAEKAVKKVATTLRKCVKRKDFVARIGSDEFALVFADVDAQSIQTIAARIRDQIQSIEIRIPNREFSGLRLGLSAGIALGAQACDTTELVDHANLALKVVREGGRQGVLLCTPRMSARLDRRGTPSRAQQSAA